MKTALLFDPYVDTLGGGERYVLTIAQILLDQGWRVVLAWKDPNIISLAHSRFGLTLVGLKVDPQLHSLFAHKHNLYTRWQSLRNFDLVFFVSDGSVPVLFGRKILVHYQVPFMKTNSLPLTDMVKLTTVSFIVVNSKFTKVVIDKTLHTNRSVVLYPPVDTKIFKETKKENIILNVGRFASPSHPKRQDVLIEAFRTLSANEEAKDWQLILAGGVHDQDKLSEIKSSTSDLNIKFVENPNFSELVELYERSSIYWHAAGYQVDESINPEAVEHFGITTVEAMAAGCVPVVIGKGGQKEIVDIDSGFLCQTPAEIASSTLELINSPLMCAEYSIQCQLRAKLFNLANFQTTFLNLLK